MCNLDHVKFVLIELESGPRNDHNATAFVRCFDDDDDNNKEDDDDDDNNSSRDNNNNNNNNNN